MRLGLNVLAVAAIVAGVIAGAVAAVFLAPLLAVASGAAVTCAVDFGYRIVRRDFEGSGAYLEVRPVMGSPTRIPVWIIGFALALGLGGMSFLKQPGDTTSSTDVPANLQAPFRAPPPEPVAAPKGTVEQARPVDRKRADAFLAFFKRWQKLIADDTHDCAYVAAHLQEVSRRFGADVRDVYSSGLSLPQDVQSEFDALRDQLKTAAARCPDIRIDDEIARVAAGEGSDN